MIHRIDLTPLSARQKEVFYLLSEGLTTQQISELLGIVPKTVECHRGNIQRLLKLKGFRELYRAAYVDRTLAELEQATRIVVSAEAEKEIIEALRNAPDGRIVKLKQGDPVAKTSFPGSLNTYQCWQCGKLTVTINRDEGYTPATLDCPRCGKPGAKSAFYRNVCQTLIPEHEWTRPEGMAAPCMLALRPVSRQELVDRYGYCEDILTR